MKQPAVSLPSPQTALAPGTWAHKTISERFKNIASRILMENEFSSSIETRLQALIDEIPNTPIRLLNDPDAPDEEIWNIRIIPYLNQNWYQPPWLFTEHYFYRRILEATGYFQPGDGQNVDPFQLQKRMGLDVAKTSIHELMTRIQSWLREDSKNPDILQTLLYLDLWGNQADLSLWPAEGGEKPDHTDVMDAQSHILVDDSAQVVDLLLHVDSYKSRLDILVDNAGFELICDLALVDYFLTANLVSSVRLHLKAHPTYVSDAMVKDVLDAIEFLKMEIHPDTQNSGKRLQAALKSGDLELRENYFWNSPIEAWKMPETLRDELAQSSFVISKGDANYRRLLGDRHWAYETPFHEILDYYPVPMVALRTLKSELIAGLEPGQAEGIAAIDPEWLVNGKWGVVQCYGG